MAAKVIIEVFRGRAEVVHKTPGVTVLIKDLDLSKDGKNIKRLDDDQVVGDQPVGAS